VRYCGICGSDMEAYQSGMYERGLIICARAPEAIQTRPGDPIYLAFELSFPLADGWFVLACVLGAVGLWRMRDWGLLFTLLAGSVAIFLGLMDLLFDLQQGIFVPLTGEALIELVIVVLLLTLGPFVIVAAWRQRGLFLGR